jgi:hypothetical protein
MPFVIGPGERLLAETASPSSPTPTVAPRATFDVGFNAPAGSAAAARPLVVTAAMTMRVLPPTNHSWIHVASLQLAEALRAQRG